MQFNLEIITSHTTYQYFFEMELAKHSNVKLTVYDILGRELKKIEDNNLSAGFYEINWNGPEVLGKKVNSGIYFYRLSAKGESGKEYNKVMKMLMIK